MQSFAVFDQIAVGAMLYFATERMEGFLRLHKTLCVVLTVSGGIAILAAYFGTNVFYAPDRVLTPTVLAVGLAVFLLGGLQLNLVSRRNLFVQLGRISYGCYLLHATVLYLLWDFLARAGFLAGFTFFLFSTVAVAAISFRCLETPASAWIRRPNRFAVERSLQWKHP